MPIPALYLYLYLYTPLLCIMGAYLPIIEPQEADNAKKERKNYARGRELRKKRSLQASLPYTTPMLADKAKNRISHLHAPGRPVQR